jgi:hypothetical protein
MEEMDSFATWRSFLVGRVVPERARCKRSSSESCPWWGTGGSGTEGGREGGGLVVDGMWVGGAGNEPMMSGSSGRVWRVIVGVGEAVETVSITSIFWQWSPAATVRESRFVCTCLFQTSLYKLYVTFHFEPETEAATIHWALLSTFLFVIQVSVGTDPMSRNFYYH